MDKPIPEAVRALADELARASAQEDDLRASNAYADAAGRVRTLAKTLTAAQQQGQPAPSAPLGVEDAGSRAVAAELLRCFESWEPGVRVLGNVQARDGADLMRRILAQQPAADRETEFATIAASADCPACGEAGPCECKGYAQQPAAGAVDDTRRMDWLEQQVVEVRRPMRYGSIAMFHAEQVSDDDEPHRTDLRAQIDSALSAAITGERNG